MTTGESIDWTV